MSFYFVYKAILNTTPPGLPLGRAVAAVFDTHATAQAQLDAAGIVREMLADLESVAAHAKRAGWNAERSGGIFVFETLAQITAEEASAGPAYVFTGQDEESASYIVSSRDLGPRMRGMLILKPGDR